MEATEKRICRVCKIEKPITSYPISSQGRHLRGYECSNCAARGYRRRLRLAFLEEFGGKCSCCGEDHPQFLALEHIKGRKYGILDKKASYVALAQAKRENWDREKYTCLCHNCNLADGFYGGCPHKTGVTKEQYMATLRSEAEYVDYRRGPIPAISESAMKEFFARKGFKLEDVLAKLKEQKK